MQHSRRAFMTAAVAGLVALPTLVSAQRDNRERDARDRKDDNDRKEPRRDAAGRWEKLGERRVGKKEEHDSIDLEDKRRYTAVWFEADRGAVELDDIVVTFGNKETFSPPVKLTLREGEKTRLIDLPGEDREITRIRFHYRSVGGRESLISAWGRVAEGGRR
jgi:hypothetical protein